MSCDFVGEVASSYIATLLGLWSFYGIGNKGVCNISSNSNSIAEIPMPRSTNGYFKNFYAYYLRGYIEG